MEKGKILISLTLIIAGLSSCKRPDLWLSGHGWKNLDTASMEIIKKKSGYYQAGRTFQNSAICYQLDIVKVDSLGNGLYGLCNQGLPASSWRLTPLWKCGKKLWWGISSDALRDSVLNSDCFPDFSESDQEEIINIASMNSWLGGCSRGIYKER